MFGIFSTREIATVIWIVVFTIILLSIKKVRQSFGDVLKIAFCKHLVVPFILMIIYTLGITMLLMLFSFWENIYLKDIILWIIFIGLPLYYGSISKNIDKRYFSSTIFNNLKFIILIEFIIASFTFHIAVELFIIPLIILLTMVDVVAQSKENTKSVGKLTSWLLSIIGFLVLGSAISSAIFEYNKLNSIDSIVSLSLPLVLSVFYLPITYLFALYAKYDTVLRMISIKEGYDKKVHKLHKLKIIKACRFSYRKILWFENNGFRNMYHRMDEKEFDDLIKSLKCYESTDGQVEL